MNQIWRFLSGPYPLSFQTSDLWFFYAALTSFIAAVILTLVTKFSVRNPVTYNLLKKFRAPVFVYGLVVLIWAGFRYEHAAYLNWRLWVVVAAVVCMVWMGRSKWYLFFQYKKDLESLRSQELKQKYLSR
jgi:hypothetical protein